MHKFFSSLAIAALMIGGIVACNSDNVPAPVSQDFSAQSFVADNEEADVNEIVDDPDEDNPNARAAAAIDTALQYKLKFQVTSACVSGTAAVGFKYTEGNVTTPVLSTTAVSSKLGFKSFSVKRDKMNTPLLKTFDKTKTYSVYIKATDAIKAVKAVKDAAGTIVTPASPAVPATYKYVLTLPANPAAEKALNKAGTKRIGRPITTSTTTLSCPS